MGPRPSVRTRATTPMPSSSASALRAVADERADALPTGLARLCELGRALAARPRLLLLDEPASGLSERETETFAELLRALAAEGMAVFLVEHDVGLVMDVCASVHVIDYGALVSVGPPAEIRRNQAVLDAYLGDGSTRRTPTSTGADASARPARVATAAQAPNASASPVLELRDITAAYGKIEVLHGIDLVLPPADVVALLGPNGAGKSTTLKVASGQMKPSSGCMHLGGRHINGVSRRRAVAHRDVHDPRGPRRVPEPHRTREPRHGHLRGRSRSGRSRSGPTRCFPRLEERRSQLAGTLSGGEQRMLAMARALVTEPAVLLLDELSMGLAPLIVEELYGLVGRDRRVRRVDPRGRAVRPHRARRRRPRRRDGAGQDHRGRAPVRDRSGTVVGLLGSELMSEHEVLLSDVTGDRERRRTRRAVPGRRLRAADPQPDRATRAPAATGRAS